TSDAWQIYGYNDSGIPLLISYNELVPVAHLLGNMGLLGQMYLYSLHTQFGCEGRELWMDAARGVICRGPLGPRPDLHEQDFYIQNLPSTAELVQEDVLLRFLASVKSKRADRAVAEGVSYSGNLEWIDVLPERVSVISRSTNTPISTANSLWETNCDSLIDGRLLKNGLTRFTLANGGSDLQLEWNRDAHHAWMSQALSVFHARGISLESDLGIYKVEWPSAYLYKDAEDSEALQRRWTQRSTYLFVRSPPLDLYEGGTSVVHFWSFDEDGQSPLSDDECDDFGLPIELDFWFNHDEYCSYYWSNNNYRRIHQYQVLRGFDPATTDFARHIGLDHHIYQPLEDSDRFEQVQKGPP
ncbi:hypothetical protein PQX77_019453, partial [Marasmius sp. AFHP31]